MNLKELVASLRRDADELEQLDRMLSGLGQAKSSGTARKAGRRGVLSAKARAAISKAQKERWAKVRAAKSGKKG